MSLAQAAAGNAIWQKWIDHMTGAHGIEQGAIVRQDGNVLASRDFNVTKQEILEIKKYFRTTESESVQRSNSVSASSSVRRTISSNSTSRERTYTISTSSKRTISTSSTSSQGECQGQLVSEDGCSESQGQDAVEEDADRYKLMSLYLQGRTYVVRMRSTDQILAFSGPMNVIVRRSKRLYLIAVCNSRQVVAEACQFMAQLTSGLSDADY